MYSKECGIYELANVIGETRNAVYTLQPPGGTPYSMVFLRIRTFRPFAGLPLQNLKQDATLTFLVLTEV